MVAVGVTGNLESKNGTIVTCICKLGRCSTALRRGGMPWNMRNTSPVPECSGTPVPDNLAHIWPSNIRKTYILLYHALSFFFMLFHAFSCFSVKAREKYNKSNPPYFSECLGIWLKK